MIFRSFFASLILSLLLAQMAMAQISISPNEDMGRSFNFEIPAGQEVSSSLKIRNLLDEETLVKIYPIDATQSSSGTLAFTTLDVPQNSIGKWTTIKQPEMVVKNRGTVQAPFTINVPADTPPGTYIGGLAVEEISETNQTDTPNKQVTVSARVVSKIYIKVPGEITHKYEWQNFKFNQNPDKEFNIDIQNIGNSLVTTTGTIQISNIINNKQDVLKLTPVNIFAKNSATITTEWQNKNMFGIYKATANVTFGRYDFLTRRSLDNKIETREITIIIVPQWAKILLILAIFGPITFYIIRKLLSKKTLRNSTTYEVKKGDNLNSIAEKFNTSWKKLASINKLKAPYTLKEKDSLLIPPSNNEKDI